MLAMDSFEEPFGGTATAAAIDDAVGSSVVAGVDVPAADVDVGAAAGVAVPEVGESVPNLSVLAEAWEGGEGKARKPEISERNSNVDIFSLLAPGAHLKQTVPPLDCTIPLFAQPL